MDGITNQQRRKTLKTNHSPLERASSFWSIIVDTFYLYSYFHEWKSSLASGEAIFLFFSLNFCDWLFWSLAPLCLLCSTHSIQPPEITILNEYSPLPPHLQVFELTTYKLVGLDFKNSCCCCLLFQMWLSFCFGFFRIKHIKISDKKELNWARANKKFFVFFTETKSIRTCFA